MVEKAEEENKPRTAFVPNRSRLMDASGHSIFRVSRLLCPVLCG